MRRALATAGFCLALLASAARADDHDRRAGAWDRSVEQERAGDLAAAEATMVRGWGAAPENYWVRLRLAYLALLQQRLEEARARYVALRARPEAKGDRDPTLGLASTLALKGWELAALGFGADARASFREALALDPESALARRGLREVPALPRVLPEVWGGIAAQSLGRTRTRGPVGYAQLAVRVTDRLTVRGAGRFLSMSEVSGPSPWAFSGKGKTSFTMNEEFLAVSRQTRGWGGELVAARSDSAGRPAILGGAARLRVGDRWGLAVETAFLQGETRNVQARPLLFARLGAAVEVHAGARLTADTRGNTVAATGGLSLALGPIAVHLQGHAGDERWAFGFAGPSILAFDSVASAGGRATLTWDVGRVVRLALQGEAERLHLEGATGSAWSASLGVLVPLGSL